MKPILYIDLDGVVADFELAIHTHPLRDVAPYDIHPDTIPGIFRDLKPIRDAISSINKILQSNQYEVYFLSTAPWNNPSAWTDKRLWLEDHFGEKINRRLILTHRKDLIKGDFLIDISIPLSPPKYSKASRKAGFFCYRALTSNPKEQSHNGFPFKA